MKTGPTMTKNDQALLFMQTHLELERRVKILELQLDQEEKRSENWRGQAIELGRTLISRNFQIGYLQKDSKVKFS